MKSDFQLSQEASMYPAWKHWMLTPLVIIPLLSIIGSMDLETQQVAAQHKQETIAAAKIAKEEKSRDEAKKVALYRQAQYMTGFGQMQASN